MNDPQRLLLDANATELERALLGSWQEEHPSAEARTKTLAMLGLSTGAIVGAATVGGSIAPKALAAGSVWILKWAVLGALVLGTTALTVAYVRAHSHADTRFGDAPAMTTTAPPAQLPRAAPQASPATPAPIDVESLPAPTTKTAEPKSPRATRHPEVHESGGLGVQITTMDRARAALSAGDPKGALVLVDEYEARFPGGAFGQEAEVLRVEALLAEGDRTGANQVGARFLASHPTSPHAAHIRALLGGSP